MVACSGEPLSYTDNATPRHQVSDQIYSSTDYPADQRIELHNECAYARTWPLKVFFYCAKAAASGGETPIADCRAILRRLAPETVERFRTKGVMYVRNFGNGLGLPWPRVFGTDDLDEVKARCEREDIQLEQTGDGQLRTRQRRDAIRRHPRTNEETWFNQVIAFHPSSLPAEIREVLLADMGADDLPKNALYGDGTPIEEAALEEIREASALETVAFPWQEGDVLMLDNMFVAHGRSPFTGPRKILVGMTEPC
jgi:hypothetical protein